MISKHGRAYLEKELPAPPPEVSQDLKDSYDEYLKLFRHYTYLLTTEKKHLDDLITELTYHPYVHAHYGRSMYMINVNEEERTWRGFRLGSPTESISDAYWEKIQNPDRDVIYDRQKMTVEFLNPQVIDLYERKLLSAF